jgi:LAO/AO transport system kinase
MGPVGTDCTDHGGGLERLLAGDRGALGRALSLLERGDGPARGLVERLRPHAGRARVVGFTGPPGAGKSTLVSAYVAALRERHERVAVLAVDPSSPLSGGALLGDRARMGSHANDQGVFIRSVAARGHLGGLARSMPALLDAVDAAGWPTIVIETVGAGQSEIEVAELAEVTVVLDAPGLGDEVQALKAGLLEVADVLVVNKADLPFSDRAGRNLERMLQLRDRRRPVPSVVSTSATTGEGVAELADAIAAVWEERRAASDPAAARLQASLVRSAQDELVGRLGAEDGVLLDAACARVLAGEISTDDAVAQLLASLFGQPDAR